MRTIFESEYLDVKYKIVCCDDCTINPTVKVMQKKRYHKKFETVIKTDHERFAAIAVDRFDMLGIKKAIRKPYLMGSLISLLK